MFLDGIVLDHQQILALVAAAGMAPDPVGAGPGKVGQFEIIDIERRHTASATGQGEADLDDLVPGIEVGLLGGARMSTLTRTSPVSVPVITTAKPRHREVPRGVQGGDRRLDAPEVGMVWEPGEEAWEAKLASCARTSGPLEATPGGRVVFMAAGRSSSAPRRGRPPRAFRGATGGETWRRS